MSPGSSPLGSGLLRQRRQELGLPPDPPPLRSSMALILLGSGLGLLFLVIPLVAKAWCQVRIGSLQRQLDQLSPVEIQVQRLRGRLTKSSTLTKKLQNDTADITSKLVSIRSGSAFLEQLKRLTPVDVSLQSVSVQPAQLRISGDARSDQAVGAWEQINAFALNLETSPAVPIEGAKVQEANAQADASIRFTLNVTWDPSVVLSPEQLRELGADALADRHLLLREKGLPL